MLHSQEDLALLYCDNVKEYSTIGPDYVMILYLKLGRCNQFIACSQHKRFSLEFLDLL